MTTDTIKAKYDFGFDEGKNALIRTSFSYGMIGLVIGAIVQIGIKMFRNNPGVAAGAVSSAFGGAPKLTHN